jgi:hypothetical protein
MPPILAIVYTDSAAAGRFISDLGYRLRDDGVAVAGIVQYGQSVRDRAGGCDMEVEELASRIILQLGDERGDDAAGCRLDPAALCEAAALISAALKTRPQLVILNKFGVQEAAGSGLRDAVADAMHLGIPVIAGVPHRHIEPWRAFTDGLAQEIVVDSSRLQQWLTDRGFGAKRQTIAAAAPARVQRAG